MESGHPKDDVETLQEGESSDATESTTCPLFMNGLPSDFSSNPQLAALASLLEENEKDEEKEKLNDLVCSRVKLPTGKPGGGKVRANGRKQRQTAVASPYRLPEKSPKTKPTLGEAQLFLKMWKI